VIRVRSTVTRAFELDYIRATRSGNASASASATASLGGGGGAGVVSASNTMNDSVTFWQEIDQQIKSLLSPRGKVLINRLTGTIIVTDSAPKIEEVENFLALIKDGMNRQVDIEVRIVEVTLNEDFALGLDWSRLKIGDLSSFATNTIVSGPAGVSALPSTFAATYASNNYSAVIQALKQQGDVRMVSQPRIRIMNNQTAFVKVGTSDTYYSRTNYRTTTAGIGISDTINEQPTTVNLGVMMTVTPQISSDGWTMLQVAPTVTRLAGTTVSPSGQSTAPVLDIKEASTLVRARSGELVVLGGLIEEEGSKTTRAVPGVGEGTGSFNPFRAEYKASRRKELVIFLMPTVIANK
jgi:MSHA type pilus biogenesis protein MshL